VSAVDPNNAGVIVVPGGGGSIAAGDISGAGTTGIALVQASTPTAALAALGSSTAYAFASASGVTLTNRSGTAAIASGVLTLSNTTNTNHNAATLTSPGASVAIPAVAGRAPTRVRARVRIAAMALGGAAREYVHLDIWDAAGKRYTIFAGSDGDGGVRRDDSIVNGGSIAGGTLTAAIAGGTLVIEAEVVGGYFLGRYSLDSGATWTTVAGVDIDDATGGTWTAVHVCGAVPTGGAAPSTTATITCDDLVVETWP
jgi:hypothetical protein